MATLEGLKDVIQEWWHRHYVCNNCGDSFTIASDPNHDDGGASLKTLKCVCGKSGDYRQVSAPAHPPVQGAK